MSQQTENAASRTKSIKRSHSMRFGTSINDDGTVSFRLWAPNCRSVKAVINENGSERTIDMKTVDGGWTVGTGRVAPGATYKFVTDEGLAVPDPASRFQPDDVHGSSEIIDPTAFEWRDSDWKGRPWSSTVLYELHVGTFTPAGTFAGVESKLDYLRDLGITAIELMPVADFPGKFGWGYDGVLPFAPDSSYGTPDHLKSLVQTAHQKGLQVFLDVVYNHFGPEGNYLHAYAGEFFTDRHKTPWGAALDFEGHTEVREFFIENALYWLEEYNIDGLRLDAVHAIKDDSSTHFLAELASRVASGPGTTRHRHLVLENDDNIASFLERDKTGKPSLYAAQWNDDIHHAYHVIATGESGGYYSDYVKNQKGDTTLALLGRALAEGFIYQDEPSNLRDGERRGEKSAHLPPDAFISFIQNHDQVGNRAYGDRIAALTNPSLLKALVSIQLLAPSIPLLFMGEEWAASTPFMYFCDLGPELAPLVTEGRRNEFAKFPEFSNPETRHKIPDPCRQKTFEESKLDWKEVQNSSPQSHHKSHHDFVQSLLKLRQSHVVPLISQITSATYKAEGNILSVQWKAGNKPILTLLTNLCRQAETIAKSISPSDQLATLYEGDEGCARRIASGHVPPYSVLWQIEQ